jgi:hypothetical protein
MLLKDDKNEIYPKEFLPLAEREGRKNSKKLYKKRNFMEISINSFTSRVIDNWNDLPEADVSGEGENEFKGRLDNHMRHFRGRTKASA